MFAVWNMMPMKNGVPLEKYKKSVEESADRQRPLTEAIFVNAFMENAGHS